METERTYSPDEVTAIVASALRRHRERESIGYDELKEIAAEMGIPPQDLAEAARHLATERDMERARQQWRDHQRQAFRHHLVSYLIVNSFLFLFNLLTGPGHWWFYWPALGWGVGLAFHIQSTFFPDPRHVERGARRLLARQRRKRLKFESDWESETPMERMP